MKAIIIACMATLSINAAAQQAIPMAYALNAAGLTTKTDGISLEHSIGEMVLVHTANAGQSILTQGYLQPAGRNEPAMPEALPVPNNVLTPNGDGKNDRLVIPDIEKFPGNRLVVFDRAGREIYRASPYRNEWDGLLNGRLLGEDTYYYIFLPAENYAPVKGFISIIHNK